MSNSRAYTDKKKELKEKESLILSGFDRGGSRFKQVLLWSLVAGLVGLISWGIYRSVSPSKGKKKSKKNRKNAPKDIPMIDSILENAAPRLGKWILKEFETKSK